jgi:hypothetical protein
MIDRRFRTILSHMIWIVDRYSKQDYAVHGWEMLDQTIAEWEFPEYVLDIY